MPKQALKTLYKILNVTVLYIPHQPLLLYVHPVQMVSITHTITLLAIQYFLSRAGYFTVDESISSDVVPVVPQQIMTTVSPQMVDFPHPTVQCLVPGMQKCALAECPNPSYIDENGTVHSCCGRAHAKEYDQRQAQQCEHAIGSMVYTIPNLLFSLFLSSIDNDSSRAIIRNGSSGTINSTEMCYSGMPKTLLCRRDGYHS